MKELNRDIFEKEWELAFNNAELLPSENLWTKVELTLANAEGGAFKKRLFIFKLLAAASVSFAMVVGGWQLYKSVITPSQSINTIAKNETKGSSHDSNMPINQKSEESVNAERKPSDKNGFITNELPKEDRSISDQQNKQSIDNTLFKTNSKEVSSVDALVQSNISDQSIKQGAPKTLVALTTNLDLEAPAIAEFKMVPWFSYVSHSKRRSNPSNLWAGVNISAGNYQPNQNGGKQFASEALTNDGGGLSGRQAVITDEQMGRSIGVGLNVGKQMTNRLALLSGFNYLQQTTTSQSNIVASKGAQRYTVSDLASAQANSQLELTDTYEINSTYELISIPVQAGYLVLDRRFDVMILGGVANDLFLKKRVSDNTSDANSTTATATDNGYSIYSISGLFGTELSYAIGESYSISLQPQVRQAFTSFTPNDNKPTVLEVGFKFKYIIK
ncbi:MAG TPA: hypothetical protein PKL31_16605 [Fulvivirga sp.]|nr:hypothetical protein [Fulvivirga sp.]